MGWNPNLVLYACVAKGPTVLAEHASMPTSAPAAGREAEGIESIARRCVERTPPHHSCFSHTVQKKSYTFLIDDPFAYFVVCHEDLGLDESLQFLDRVKGAFKGVVGGGEGVNEVSDLCLQGKMCPSFRGLLGLGVGNGMRVQKVESGGSLAREEKERDKTSPLPLVTSPGKVMMKKKKKKRFFGSGGGEVNGDHCGVDLSDVADKGWSKGGVNDNAALSKEFSVSMMQKGGTGGGAGAYFGDGRQKAKQMWRKHVWIVFVLDLVICVVLFGIWLWVCRGFKCIDG